MGGSIPAVKGVAGVKIVIVRDKRVPYSQLNKNIFGHVYPKGLVHPSLNI